MKNYRLGHLEYAAIDMFDGAEHFIDWRMEDMRRRWRIKFAWGHDLYVIFSERYGYKPGPKRWRIGPLRIAWYATGVE
ncbi:hypothetical protein MHY85_05280 [Cellulomonas sp. ACRRI]|uniref:hypothetical protein n=1 Tax=Cellulomonas sp. ACRRI TaxID=2918188 RepID=UPI001EF23B28|nr:hypothetical protein [Cellulomonas sp. ACRRI]MCG7285388.1 hypothetical protein [Cellulomonas sp. ACRRI]